MANINRYDKVGRIWVKNNYNGVFTNDTGVEDVIGFKLFPAMTMPHRMWLSWRIFSNPGDQLDPHVTNEMILSVRAANIPRAVAESGSNFDSQAKLQDIVEDYMPKADAQVTSESTDAEDVGITGGHVMTQQGKISTLMPDRKYHLGLPNHAMLIAGSHIMFHCIGNVSSDRNRFAVPMSVNVEEPFAIAMCLTRETAITAGTGEEHSVMGGVGASALYDKLFEAIPVIKGEPDYTISSNDLDANVKNWQTQGWTNGTYASVDEPDLHYNLNFTADTSIYTSKSSNTILAP